MHKPTVNLSMNFVLAKISYKFPLLCWKFLIIIMLYAFQPLLCLKLCWHNRLKPTSSKASVLYKIDNLVWKWIQGAIWLTECSQSVVVDGTSSKPVSVLSGVPQGTVLGPLIFCCTLIILLTEYPPHFAYLLMIVSYIETSNPIQTLQDSILLQKDLHLLSHWASIWQMKFNTTKCVVLRCSRSPTLLQHDYRLNDHVLDIKDVHPYLGITLHKSLSWTSHISKISTKASQTFNFSR